MKKIGLLIIFSLLVLFLQNSIVELHTELTTEEKIYVIQKIIQSLGGQEYYTILQPKNSDVLFKIMGIDDKQMETVVLGFKTCIYNAHVLSFDRKLEIFEDCIAGMPRDFYTWINPIIVEKALTFLETKIDVINFCQAIKTDYYDQTLYS